MMTIKNSPYLTMLEVPLQRKWQVVLMTYDHVDDSYAIGHIYGTYRTRDSAQVRLELEESRTGHEVR